MVDWMQLSKLLTQLVEKYSGIIYDLELRRSWDIGQALCRGVYGKDWSNNEQYKKDDESETEPLAAIQLAKDWLENGLPKWAEVR